MSSGREAAGETMSRARGTTSPDLGAPAADTTLPAVSSRPTEEEAEGGRRRAIRVIAAIVEEEVEVGVVWWAGLNRRGRYPCPLPYLFVTALWYSMNVRPSKAMASVSPADFS